MKRIITRLLFGALILASSIARADESTRIYDLKLNHCVRPAAVEDLHPHFCWKMASDKPGQSQVAYRITVRRDTDGRTVWDSGTVEDSLSTAIPYLGISLQPRTGYDWTLEVTDSDGIIHEASSRFDTGLMDPKISAWKGGTWIGDPSPSLDAASLYRFSIEADVTIVKGGRAGFIFGANDFRLKDRFQNSFGLEGDNYFKVILDLSTKGTASGSRILVYRVGYAKGDKADKPLLTINKAFYPNLNLEEIVSSKGLREHHFKVVASDGALSFEVDGVPVKTEEGDEASEFQVGCDSFNSFPHLCSVGFAAEPGTDVTYTGYRIETGGRNGTVPVFYGKEQYARFEDLSCIRIPKYRNSNAYEMDIVVINKEGKEVVETIDPSYGGARMLRTEFSTAEGKTVRKARLYATALGIYEISLNGRKVGNDWFAPGSSQYRERITYQAYDVTPLLRSGANALGAEIFEGWYSGYTSYDPANYNFYGDTQALLCRLDIVYDDGSEESIVSDPEGWKVSDGGPVRACSFFQGERYDARFEAAVNGWSEPGFNDASWKKAEAIVHRTWLHPDITARMDGLVQVREALKATGRSYIHSDDYHTYIYDLGVNINGVPEITIPAGWLKKGDTVIMRYAEQLYPGLRGDSPEYVRRFGPKGRDIAGHMLYENSRKAMNADFYIASGDGEVTIRPRSTWRGWQYIQITIPSHEGPLPLENVRGLVLSSCSLPTGSYEATSDDGTAGELATDLMLNIQRSQTSNFFTLPLDCPTRNERMGWTGDAQVFCLTASYNTDTYAFFRQWMQSLRDDQGKGGTTAVPGSVVSAVPTFKTVREPNFAEATTWAAAVCMVPWQMYRQYGDRQIVEENLEAMVSWLGGMSFYPLSEEYPHLSAKTGVLGDWLAPDPSTPDDLVNNAIYIGMMDVTARMARDVGRDDIAATLERRYELAKLDWNRAYVDPVTLKTRSLDGKTVDSQTSYATPLRFGVFSDEYKAAADSTLATLALSRTLTTGFSGTPNILPALSAAGKWDEALGMFLCTDCPSWLYPVTRGATSVWERWDGLDAAFAEDPGANSMNSFNHFAPGSVGEWMYEYQLGISPGPEAGYKHFVLQPLICGFASLRGSFESEYGRIESRWTTDAEGRPASYFCSVPTNSSATLYLPVDETVSEFGSGPWAEFVGTCTHNGVLTAEYRLNSGTHEFIITYGAVAVQ